MVMKTRSVCCSARVLEKWIDEKHYYFVCSNCNKKCKVKIARNERRHSSK